MDNQDYVSDIYLPQMLYALTIRSPVAKGWLISIDCPKLSGSYTLITAEDIPGKNSLYDSGLPILAAKELSYIGEPVALLLGPDKNRLEEYARNCKVHAGEHPPVYSMGDAAAGAASETREINIGDPKAAFAGAASVIRGSYKTGIQEHWYAEPSGAVAWVEQKDGDPKTGGKTLVVRTATQWPFHVSHSVAKTLGIAASAVLVKPAMTGYHMDGKIWYPSLIACQAALCSWITEKPVRLTLTRNEDFSYSPKRCGTEIEIASAHDEKGGITGIEIKAAVNLGAHPVYGDELLDHVCLGSLGIYNIKNIHFSGAAFTTNIPPQGPFAGFGLAQGFFALERHVSRIADSGRQDPAQWRIEHFPATGTLPHGVQVKDAAPGEVLVNTVVAASDYRRKWASYELLRQKKREKGEIKRGIGIALGYQGSGLLHSSTGSGSCGIEMTLEKDGTLEIKTSMISSGSDYVNVWGGIASDILAVDKGMVRIHCNTGSPDSGPSTMSRNVSVFTRLIEQACIAIRKQRFRKPLPITVRKKMRPQKNSAWEECFPGKTHSPPDYSGFERPGWASAVVEIEIDPVEFIPRIRGVWMTVDGGKIVSEAHARRVLSASVIQALGWSYLEQLGYVDGIIPPEQYDNFDIPDPVQIPKIEIGFVESGSVDPRGIGDLPFNCVPAAFLQAVSQALDRQLDSIPLKAQDIWEAGKKA